MNSRKVVEDSHKAHFKCAFCDSSRLTEVLDLGEVALAGGFLQSKQFDVEPKFPLRVVFCNECLDYFYFSSQIKTLRDHFEDYATEVVSRFLEPKKSTVLEFGCNDGVLLRPLAGQGIKTLIGVDPASNIISTINDERINVINDFFTVDTSKRVVEQFGKLDMVIANNVFAHIPDICGVTRAIREGLSDDGVFIFEVHYLGKIIQGMQYDMIYHEHLYYYSLLALENHFHKHHMVVFDVKPIPIHGGSMRYYVCKRGAAHAKNISTRVELLRKEELTIGYDKPETYQDFAKRVQLTRKKLTDVLDSLSRKGRTIAGYGASGRANTIIQYCNIDKNYVSYMIDDAPAKKGFFTPGSHLEIFSNDILNTNPPDYLLIFAWSFINEIAAKCENYMNDGGKLLIPLPEVRIMMTPYSEDIL